MESNYIKSLMIKLKRHPEWNQERKFEEISKAYGKEGSMCYLMSNNSIIIIPQVQQGCKPIKFIYEKGEIYE